MNSRPAFFEQLNSFFDAVYVLSLERATERHEHIRKELQGLSYEVFYGVDKKDLDPAALNEAGIYNEQLAIRHHRYTKPLLPGMIGCSWSHRNIYDDIIRNNYDKVLILEDDIVIDEKAAASFNQMLAELPSNWELVYLGYARHEAATPAAYLKKFAYHFQRLLGKHKFSHTTIRNLYPKKVSTHVYRSGYHDQTHAYGLTRSGAEKLRKLQEPISYIADNLLAHAATNHILEAYVFHPKIINQLSQGEEKKTGTYIND